MRTSKGIPRIARSNAFPGSSRHRAKGSRMNPAMPEKVKSGVPPYLVSGVVSNYAGVNHARQGSCSKVSCSVRAKTRELSKAQSVMKRIVFRVKGGKRITWWSAYVISPYKGRASMPWQRWAWQASKEGRREEGVSQVPERASPCGAPRDDKRREITRRAPSPPRRPPQSA